jgi:hypothetical protein
MNHGVPIFFWADLLGLKGRIVCNLDLRGHHDSWCPHFFPQDDKKNGSDHNFIIVVALAMTTSRKKDPEKSSFIR